MFYSDGKCFSYCRVPRAHGLPWWPSKPVCNRWSMSEQSPCTCTINGSDDASNCARQHLFWIILFSHHFRCLPSTTAAGYHNRRCGACSGGFYMLQQKCEGSFSCHLSTHRAAIVAPSCCALFRGTIICGFGVRDFERYICLNFILLGFRVWLTMDTGRAGDCWCIFWIARVHLYGFGGQ